MKVVLLSFNWGEYCVRLASALAHDEDVLLLLAKEQAEPHLAKLNPSVRFQSFDKPRFRQLWQQMRMIATIVRAIKRFDPDLIHLQMGHMWFNLALPLLRQYPLVLTIHDPRHHIGDRESQKQWQPVIDFGYRRASHVITHGVQLKQVVQQTLGIPGDRIHVIPHIVLGDDTAKTEVQEHEHCILFFGRIWRYKGLEYLIRAEPLITAQVPQARIVIAGTGDNFVPYRRMMVHPEHFCIYNEYVPNDERAVLFRQASVVVLPYIEATQSGVIPLAYTFAKPVVATAVGGIPEIVDHGHTGYLVPPRDEKALADAVVRLLQDPDLRRQFGANGKRKIDTTCAPEAIAQHTLAVYQHVLGRSMGN